MALVAFCAWGYVTLRHRDEKQGLVYSINTRLRASHITKAPARSQGLPYDSVKPDDVMLDDALATQEMKRVARDIMSWCFLRWGGLFGARAGSDSMGIKLGIWSDRFENVRCAVMLLALRQVNVKFKAENQKAKSAAGGPGNTMPYYSPNSIDATIACAGLHSKRCMHATAY